MKKKLKIIISSIVLLMCMFLYHGEASDVVASANVADNADKLVYEVKDDGTIAVGLEEGDTIQGELVIPSEIDGYTVTEIKYKAFTHSEFLKEVTIPYTVNDINITAFYKCVNLKNIVVKKGNEKYSSINGVLFNANGTKLIYYPEGKSAATYTVPKGVKTIGEYGFNYNDYLTKIVFPDSLTKIEGGAFYKCSVLESITLSKNIQQVDAETLLAGSKIKNVYTVKNHTSFASIDGVLYNKAKTKLILYPKRTQKQFKVPDTVTEIGAYAFYNSAVEEVIMPKGLKRIDDGAFEGTRKLQNIDLPKKIEVIGRDAFSWGGISWLLIPSSVKELGRSWYEDYERDEYEWGYIIGIDYAGTKAEWKKVKVSSSDIKPWCYNRCKDDDTEHSYQEVKTKATTLYEGSRDLQCKHCGDIKKTYATWAKIGTVKLSTVSYVYNGKVKTPTVVVKNANGKKLTKGTDYTVSYAKGRKKVGKYTVTVKFKGNYTGTVKKTFKIKPKATSISKLSKGKKAFTVKWSKRSTQTSGYQICYGTSTNRDKGKKVTITSYKTTSKKISGLKRNKKYYVWVRTYKTVNGTKYYSNWSSRKYVTTK